MGTYRAPDSDVERITFLRQTAVAGSQEMAKGNRYVRQEILDAIRAFLPEYEAAVQAVDARLSARVQANGERTAVLGELRVCTRQFWGVLRKRVRRAHQPAAVLAFYGLPVEGRTPNPAVGGQWLALASAVIAGDEAAVAAGYPAMVNPSAEELRGLLAVAQAGTEGVAVADRDHLAVQNAVAALRLRADGLIAEVVADLRYHLRGLEPARRRRVMRSYGARFRGRNGDEAEGAPDAAQPEGEPA